MSERNEFPRDLPVLDGGPEAARLDRREGEDLAAAAERLVADSPLHEQVDAAMAGHSSPRIWLLLHEPGAGADAALTALSFARALAERDQAALVLDCDERDLALTRWAGREGAEGWVDLVRYGASVLTCGQSLPYPGRTATLLGLGSYAPADVTAEEIEALIARLRRQADDLILVCPADETGRLWAPSADIRLLCGGRDAAAGERAAEFARAGSPLTGWVGFGPAAAAPAPPAAEAGPVVADEPAGTPEDEVSAAVDRLAEAGEPAPTAPVVPPAGAEFARRKGTSGVFRFVAAAGLVVIALAVGYYLRFVREPAAPTAALPPPTAPAGTPVPAADSTAVVGVDSLTVARADTAVAPAGGGDLQATAVAAGDTVRRPAPAGAPPLAAVPEPEPAAPAAAARDSFFMDYYLVPVGGDGWALHVYSFPDSAGAATQTRLLEARGFQTAWRTIEIKDKGRWFRIYLGSFRSKSEALAAREPLLRELGEDWASPARF